MASTVNEQLEFFTVPSPCIGVCSIDEQGFCKGCMRKREERFGWLDMTPAQQLHVIKLCRQRYRRKMAQSGKADDFLEKVKEYSSQLDIDSAIQEEFEKTIFSGRPIDELSRKALKVLFLIIERFFLPILLSCIATAFMDESSFVWDFFKDKETVAEVQQGIAETSFEGKYQKYRVVTAIQLDLKEHPDKASNIIGILLLGAVVEDLESDEQWIHVRAAINDDDVVTGWVEKRYTQKVRTSEGS